LFTGYAILWITALKIERTVISTLVEEIHDQLIAFYPAYTDQGSMTRIIYGSGDTDREAYSFESRQVENVKRSLARCYAVDLRAQAKLLRNRYARKLPLHFYLPDGRVFAAFKLRQPRIGGDASYGYVDLDRIERLIPGSQTEVQLRSGTRLPVFSTIRTARLSYLFALEVKRDLTCLPAGDYPALAQAVNTLQELSAGLQRNDVRKPRRYWLKYSRPK